MTIGAIIFIVTCTLIPTFAVAFGITATILDKKHKIGELSYVEFSKRHERTLEQFECSRKDLDRTVDRLKQSENLLR